MVSKENFYSRASCEARRWKTGDMLSGINFYSRASCEARQAQWRLILLAG